MAKEDRSSGINRKFILAFVCMALLAFSLPSSLITMNASGQNSTSSDASSGGNNSSNSQTQDSSSSADTTTSSENNTNGTTTHQQEQQPSSQNTTTTTSSSDVAANSTDATTTDISAVESSTNNTTTQMDVAVPPLVTLSGEPFVLADNKITRSFSYPTLKFNGEVVAELTVTITWDTDGTTKVEDNRGYSYTISIPESQGAFALWYNSTHVVQRAIGPELQYDVYWIAGESQNGYIDKYKFTIAGTSVNGSIISFNVDGGKYDEVEENKFIVRQPAYVDDMDTSTLDPTLDWTPRGIVIDQALSAMPEEHEKSENGDGLELDWSDAISSGYSIGFNKESSTINILVGKSFVIDPTVVGTTSQAISPSSDSSFDGQARVITTGDNVTDPAINVFYYDGSNIVYRQSSDNGKTWGSPISTATGTLASDTYSWTVLKTNSTDIEYVSLLYWTPAGSNMNFYAKRGTISGNSITWSSAILLGYTSANSQVCGSGGACASVTAVRDVSGNIYAAFSWLSGGTTSYSVQIMRSTDGGLTWSTSLHQVWPFSDWRPSMALTPLNSSKMLFAYTKYDSADLFYRVYDGSAWGAEQSISNTGMAANTIKQISAASNSTLSAFVAYTNITGTNGGVVKIARFSNTGVFEGLETTDSTLRHTLPSISFNSRKALNVYTLADGKVYNTRRSGETWEAPFNPFGTSFNSPNQLTSTAALEGAAESAVWREGTSSPYNIVFGILLEGVLVDTSVQQSPGRSDYYEGERRVVSDSDGTLRLAFYYDGSNIAYRSSIDGGHTWSGTPISTGTGSLGSDYFRWTIASTRYNTTDRVTLLYFKTSGGSTTFYAKTFIMNNNVLSLVNTVSLFSATNDASCTPAGVCAASSGASDSNGILYAAFSYKTAGTWYARVMTSTDGGQTWTNSLGPSSISSTGDRVPITITKLDNGKMLLVLAKYDAASMFYRIFDGSSWGSSVTLSSIGWSSNTVKQISSDTFEGDATNSTTMAYIAYVTGGNQGSLKVAKFFGNGTYQTAETATSSIGHQLPSISITEDEVKIFSIANSSIYITKRNSTMWEVTEKFFNNTASPDELTAQIAGSFSSGVLWRDGNSSPYSFKFIGESSYFLFCLGCYSIAQVQYSIYINSSKCSWSTGKTLFDMYDWWYSTTTLNRCTHIITVQGSTSATTYHFSNYKYLKFKSLLLTNVSADCNREFA